VFNMGSNLVNLFNCTLVNNSPTGTVVYAGTQVVGKVNSNAYQFASAGVLTESGTTRTLSSVDNGKIIYCTSGSAITITTAVSLGVCFSCTVIQGGVGSVTIAQGASTTLVSQGGLVSLSGRYAMSTIICPTADTFFLGGNLA
jgi:hypothetical protein